MIALRGGCRRRSVGTQQAHATLGDIERLLRLRGEQLFFGSIAGSGFAHGGGGRSGGRGWCPTCCRPARPAARVVDQAQIVEVTAFDRDTIPDS